MDSTVGVALVYSFIAFSIVFIVLGLLTAVIYAMRLLTGSEEPKKPSSAAPATKPTPAPPAAAASTDTRHAASVTAAILAVTHGGIESSWKR
jgi:sodium pump decarboxylase gamma subunit